MDFFGKRGGVSKVRAWTRKDLYRLDIFLRTNCLSYEPQSPSSKAQATNPKSQSTIVDCYCKILEDRYFSLSSADVPFPPLLPFSLFLFPSKPTAASLKNAPMLILNALKMPPPQKKLCEKRKFLSLVPSVAPGQRHTLLPCHQPLRSNLLPPSIPTNTNQSITSTTLLQPDSHSRLSRVACDLGDSGVGGELELLFDRKGRGGEGFRSHHLHGE